MAMGQGGVEDGVFAPVPYGFVLPYPYSVPHNRENFLASSSLIGAPRSLPYPVKLYFLLICLTTIAIFLIKLVSLIKLFLKLQLNLFHQIKLSFSKN